MNGEIPGPATKEMMSEVPETKERQEDESAGKEKEDKKVEEEERREDFEQARREQEAEDRDRIEETRQELKGKTEDVPGQQTTDQAGEQKLLETKEAFEKTIDRWGIKRSGRFSEEQIEELGVKVIQGLSSTLPKYHLDNRLRDMEKRTFLAEQTSFNGLILREMVGVPGWLRSVLEYIPLQGAGFYFRWSGGALINGGMPRFLIERTMYHEYLHGASSDVFRGQLNEGATEYYARYAASKQNILHNIINPQYLPGLITYALMKRAAGSEVADEAYFNGKTDGFERNLDQKWGSGSYARVSELSRGLGLGSLRGMLFAAFKGFTKG